MGASHEREVQSQRPAIFTVKNARSEFRRVTNLATAPQQYRSDHNRGVSHGSRRDPVSTYKLLRLSLGPTFGTSSDSCTEDSPVHRGRGRRPGHFICAFMAVLSTIAFQSELGDN